MYLHGLDLTQLYRPGFGHGGQGAKTTELR